MRAMRLALGLALAALACGSRADPTELCAEFTGGSPGQRAAALDAFVRELRSERARAGPELQACLAGHVSEIEATVASACKGKLEELDTDVPSDLGVPPWLRLASFTRIFDLRDRSYSRLEADYDGLVERCQGRD